MMKVLCSVSQTSFLFRGPSTLPVSDRLNAAALSWSHGCPLFLIPVTNAPPPPFAFTRCALSGHPFVCSDGDGEEMSRLDPSRGRAGRQNNITTQHISMRSSYILSCHFTDLIRNLTLKYNNMLNGQDSSFNKYLIRKAKSLFRIKMLKTKRAMVIK